MTVYDFVGLITDPSFQTICVYSLEKEKNVYLGSADRIPAYLQNEEVQSIDTLFNDTVVLTINVD